MMAAKRKARATYDKMPVPINTVPDGWTPRAWAQRLRYLAGRCAERRPDLADCYRRWAKGLEKPCSTPEES